MAGFNKARFGPQITYDSSTGDSTFQAFSAALTENPALIIFDNQSSVSVTITDDASLSGLAFMAGDAGKTFAAGEAIIMDLRTNKELRADDFTWREGTQFFGNSAVGVGNFLISFVFAQ